MAYNDIVSRSDAAALIPEEAAREIFQAMPEGSSVMQLARRLPDLNRAQQRIPVANALASAFWRNPTDNGLAQTTEKTWQNVYLNVEELTVIVPVPRTVVEDSEYDIWAETKPDIASAFGKAFDEAVYYGTNAPSSFPQDLLAWATAASHVVSLAGAADAFDAVLGENGTCSLLEQDGYMATGHVAALGMKGKLRGLRGADGHPIFCANMQEGAREYLLDGERLLFPKNGAIVPADSLLFSAQWDQIVWALRRDLTYEIWTQAVIQDNTGAIIHNLAQQGMVALAATMRIGWARPNPPNRVNTNSATRCPVAVLAP